MKYSSILGGGAIFSKLNDLISSARAADVMIHNLSMVFYGPGCHNNKTKCGAMHSNAPGKAYIIIIIV